MLYADNKFKSKRAYFLKFYNKQELRINEYIRTLFTSENCMINFDN